MKTSIIVCMDKNGAIGKDGKIPWDCQEDMNFFRALTMDKAVICGKNTYVSFGENPLPGRRIFMMMNLMSGSTEPKIIGSDNLVVFDRMKMSPYKTLKTLEEGFAETEAFVMGGFEVYESFLPHAHCVYMTVLDIEVDNADTFFPGNVHSVREQFKQEKKIKLIGAIPGTLHIFFEPRG